MLRQLDSWTGRGGGGVAKIRACRCLTTSASNSSLFKPLLPTSLMKDKLCFGIKSVGLNLTEQIESMRVQSRRLRRAGTAVAPYISSSSHPVIWYFYSPFDSCPALKLGFGLALVWHPVGSSIGLWLTGCHGMNCPSEQRLGTRTYP